MNQKYYMRVCSITVGERVLSYPPLTLEFETRFGGGRMTEAKIYNPSPETIAMCQPKQKNLAPAMITAGYESYKGTVAIGEISSFNVERSGNDRILTIKIIDKLTRYFGSPLNIAYSGPIPASQVISDLASRFGLPVQKMDITEKTFTAGISLSGRTLGTALEYLARETKSRFFANNGNLEFWNASSRGDIVSLDSASGLLEVKPVKSGYNVKALFNWRIGPGSHVDIKSEQFSGLLRPVKGKLDFSTHRESYVEFEGRAA
jgi:hypothetical protein